MADETVQHEAELETDDAIDDSAADAGAGDSTAASSKLVSIKESIRYRRRAQQAEQRTAQLEQQLELLTAQLGGRSDELAAAEAQRDEAMQQMLVLENKSIAHRLLSQAGAIDVDAAGVLLGKQVDLGQDCDEESILRAVEQLLLDKPYLRGATGGGLPPKTAGARPAGASLPAQLTKAADRAARSGDRRDVAQYLRLRRQSALAHNV